MRWDRFEKRVEACNDKFLENHDTGVYAILTLIAHLINEQSEGDPDGEDE